MDFLNNGLLFDIFFDGFLFLFVSHVSVLLVHNRNMFLFNEGLVLFMDDRLMMLVDVLLNNHWLMMLMH